MSSFGEGKPIGLGMFGNIWDIYLVNVRPRPSFRQQGELLTYRSLRGFWFVESVGCGLRKHSPCSTSSTSSVEQKGTVYIYLTSIYSITSCTSPTQHDPTQKKRTLWQVTAPSAHRLPGIQWTLPRTDAVPDVPGSNGRSRRARCTLDGQAGGNSARRVPRPVLEVCVSLPM